MTIISSGCTHIVKLDKRLDYSIETKAKQLDLRLDYVTVKGLDSNKKLTVSRRPNGFIGSGIESTFDIGSTFNDLLEQIAFASGFSCKDTCSTIEVELDNPDLSYKYSIVNVSGFDYASFSATINVNYPTFCSPTASFSKNYNFIQSVDSNQTPSSREFSSLIDSIEAVVFELTLDINKSYNENCNLKKNRN